MRGWGERGRDLRTARKKHRDRVETYFGQELFHYFGSIVDGQDDVGDASSDKGLDLVDNHRLVAKLDQRLR